MRSRVISFQDDKDLVHEFVNNDGLECLIKVGSEADQNYQNYILQSACPVLRSDYHVAPNKLSLCGLSPLIAFISSRVHLKIATGMW